MGLIEKTPSRRGLLKGGLAGGFILAFHMPFAEASVPNAPEGVSRSRSLCAQCFHPHRPVRKTTLVMPQVEMGQGVFTSIPMIIAEELDADWSKVALEAAPPNEKLYANPMLGVQATGNSNSVRAFWTPCARPPRARGCCWLPPQPSNGASIRQPARPKTGWCFIKPATAHSTMAHWPIRRAARRRPIRP